MDLCAASPPLTSWLLRSLTALWLAADDPLNGAVHPPGVRCSHGTGRTAPFCRAEAAAVGVANAVMSEPFSMSALLTPLLGWLVDRYGGRATLCVWSAVAVLIVHLALGFTTLPASLLLLGLGLGYSVFASVIWPAVAYVVDSKALGTAYGFVTALQNLGLCIVPLVVAAVHESSRGWAAAAAQPLHLWGAPLFSWSGVELFFAALGALGIAAGLGLNCDPLVRSALNSPTGRLPSGDRIFVQDGWERSPVSSRPSPLATHP